MRLPPSAIRLHKDAEIYKIPHFATPEECETLINDANKKGYQRSEVEAKNKKTNARTSETSFLTHKQTKVGNILADKTLEIIGKEQPLEGIQVQRYNPGQKYNSHFDTFDGKDGKDQRIYTMMIYLNNVEEGGETNFPKLGLKVEPELGTAILWNNLLPNFCRDSLTLHSGEPVKKGTKYVATYWFRLKDDQLCNTGTSNFINETFRKIYNGSSEETGETEGRLSTLNIILIVLFCLIGVVILLILGIFLYKKKKYLYKKKS